MTDPDTPEDLFALLESDTVAEVHNPAAQRNAAWARTAKVREPEDKPKRKPLMTATPTKVARWLEEMTKMLNSSEWDDAKPVHIVALFMWCHTQVYGVEPAELRGLEYGKAAMLAATALKHNFNGDIPAFVDFIRWAWDREYRREQWRRSNGKEGARMTFYTQFSTSLVTDYRLDLARKAKGGK